MWPLYMQLVGAAKAAGVVAPVEDENLTRPRDVWQDSSDYAESAPISIDNCWIARRQLLDCSSRSALDAAQPYCVLCPAAQVDACEEQLGVRLA